MLAGAFGLRQVHRVEIEVLGEGTGHRQTRSAGLEQIVMVHGRVAIPVGDALFVERIAHLVVLRTKLLRVQSEDIAVERTGGMAHVALQQADAGHFAEGFFHVGQGFFTLLHLIREALQGDDAQRCLELGHAVVGAHRQAGVDSVLGVWATAVHDAGGLCR